MNVKSDTERGAEVIDICLDTQKLARHAIGHCLERGGELAAVDIIQSLLDCAEINLLTADFIGRDSPDALAAAAVCARISRRCAQAIEPFEHEEPCLRAAYAAALNAADACAHLAGREVSRDENERDELLKDTFPASDSPPSGTQI